MQTGPANKKVTKENAELVAQLFSHAMEEAYTALEKLLGTSITREGFESIYASARDILTLFDPPEDIYTAVVLNINQDLNGKFLLLLKKDVASTLAAKLVEDVPVSEEDNKLALEASALQEVGNILVGTFLRGLAEVCDLEFSCSIPDITTDMVRAILDELCVEMALSTRENLAFISALSVPEVHVSGKVLVIMLTESVSKILEGVK
jgi:chemotaxis protein CheC